MIIIKNYEKNFKLQIKNNTFTKKTLNSWKTFLTIKIIEAMQKEFTREYFLSYINICLNFIF